MPERTQFELALIKALQTPKDLNAILDVLGEHEFYPEEGVARKAINRLIEDKAIPRENYLVREPPNHPHVYNKRKRTVTPNPKNANSRRRRP